MKKIFIFILVITLTVMQVLNTVPAYAAGEFDIFTVFYAGAQKYQKNGVSASLANKPIFYNDDVYLPAAEAAIALGINASSTDNTVTVRNTVFMADSNAVVVSGVNEKTDYPPFFRNNVIYVKAEELAKACGIAYSEDATGVAVFGTGADNISWDSVWNYYEEGTTTENPKKAELLSLIEEILLVNPSAQSVIEDATSAGHPRVLANSDSFEKIKALYASDPKVKEACDVVINMASSWKSKATRPLAKYGLTDAIRMTSPIYDCGYTIIACAFAYKITGETKYADRAWEEISNFCDDTAWPDWNPYHMLDVGEAMFNCAIAYDWLYDWLSAEQKAVIREAVVDKAWRHYWNDVNGNTVADDSGVRSNAPYISADQELLRSSLWREYNRDNNWSLVIYGGAVMSALAMFDEAPQESGAIISNALQNTVGALEGYAPDGAWFEGLGYWDYASQFLVYMLSTLENTCGTDYGLGDMPGLRRTGEYLFGLTGADGVFNFSDVNGSDVTSPDLFWFAKRYNRGDLFVQTYNYYAGNDLALGYIPDSTVPSGNAETVAKALIWYVNDEYTEESYPENDNYYRDVETVTLRSGYDKNANFIGIHGGKNDDPHAHVDSGTFVIDYDGTRFAMDLGSDNYDISGGNYRYRYHAQGHNVIVINPQSDKNDGNSDNFSGGQKRWNNAKIVDFKSGKTESYAVCDLTNSYADVKSYKRGIKLTDNKSKFIIRDELTFDWKLFGSSDEIYWFMHTDADIELLSGSKTAKLTKDGKTVYVKILSGDGTFSVLEPVGLSGTVVADYDGQSGSYSNEGIQKLSIKYTRRSTTTSYNLSIGVSGSENDTFTDSAISNWSVYETTEKPYLTDIKINGISIPEFSRYRKEYTYSGNAIPEMTASGNGTVSIVKPTSMNSDAYIFVSDGNDTAVYTVKLASETLSNSKSYKSFMADGLEKSFDGDSSTSVILPAGKAVYKLGFTASVSEIAADIEASGNMTISVSEDGENYYPVYEGKSHTGYVAYDTNLHNIGYIKVESKDLFEIKELGAVCASDIKEQQVLIAKYDSEGRLTDVDVCTINMISGHTFTLIADAYAEDYRIEVFLWDMNHAIPLQKAVSIER